MDRAFEDWWYSDGKFIDPDTDDVPWFDKRQGLAEYAFLAGIRIGMARAGNYVADDAVSPAWLKFANGTIVKIVGGRLVLERAPSPQEPTP